MSYHSFYQLKPLKWHFGVTWGPHAARCQSNAPAH
uniref:Uncharacterized protein n=1 Tax=Anguilla anguilla TaxID=7936 RepID=A0A0E9UEU7_ANGAN